MTTIYYNPWLEQHKKPFGAVVQETKVDFSIIVQNSKIKDVYLVIRKENSQQEIEYHKMEKTEAESYHYSYLFTQGKGLYFYYFMLHQGEKTFFYGATKEYSGEGKIYEEEPSVIPYQATCFSKADKAPKWYREAVFYQIFPDRFHNGNPHEQINHPKKNSFIYGQHSDDPMYIKNESGEIVRWDFQ